MFAEGSPDCRRLLAMQVMNLVRSVYRPEFNEMGYPAPYHGWQDSSPGYPEDITAISRLVVRWDPALRQPTRTWTARGFPKRNSSTTTDCSGSSLCWG